MGKIYVILCANITLPDSDRYENVVSMMYAKVELYVNHVVNMYYKCIGSVISELYEAGDNCDTHFF